MKSTVTTRTGTLMVMAGEGDTRGFVALAITEAKGLAAISLNIQEATLLAGEIERAVWAAQRQTEEDVAFLKYAERRALRGAALMDAAMTAQALEDAGYEVQE